jgi:hypothetical protein
VYTCACTFRTDISRRRKLDETDASWSTESLLASQASRVQLAGINCEKAAIFLSFIYFFYSILLVFCEVPVISDNFE